MTSDSSTYLPRPFPQRLPRVCVVIFGSNPQEMVEKAEALVRDNTFIEFRLDYLPKPALAVGKIKEFLNYHPYVIAIGTCRRASHGGKFKGTAEAQLDILTKVSGAGSQLVDMEVESAPSASRLKCKPCARAAR